MPSNDAVDRLILLLILLRMLFPIVLPPIHLSCVSANYNLCTGVHRRGLRSIGHEKRDDIMSFSQLINNVLLATMSFSQLIIMGQRWRQL